MKAKAKPHISTMTIVLIGITSFVVALSGALVPGPLFTITVAETTRRGFIAGPLIILGHAILELALVVLLIMGLAPFFKDATVIAVVSIVGGIMLILMGYKMVRHAHTATFDTVIAGEQGGMHPVLSGVVGSLSNPYWTIWWATIGLGYLVSSFKLGMTGVLVFFIGHILGDLAWYSLLSYVVAKGRAILRERGYRSLFYVCGIFLVLFGGWFIWGNGG